MYHRTHHAIELHSIDARQNRVRRYVLVLTVDPTADAPYSVTSQWGRSGWFLRGERFHAYDVETALDHVKAILRRRKAHGYRVTRVDEGHPLARWLLDVGMPTERIDDTQPSLFPLPDVTVAEQSPMQGYLFR
jgi:nucleotide-binding universal stress UspA family protein